RDPLGLLPVAASPDGSLLAVGGGEMGGIAPLRNYGEVILWDVARRRERARLKGHRSTVWSLAFSADGKTLATGRFDWTAKLWDTTTGLELATLEPRGSTIVGLAFAPDGQTLATGSYGGAVKLWAAPAPPRTLPPWSPGRNAAPRGEQPWAAGLGRLVQLEE